MARRLQVIAEAAKQTPSVVKFAAGAYRLDPGELRYFIEMANVNDLEIDGGGATVVFTKPVTLIQLEHCNRVQVKNFTFDFDPPAYTAGRVLAVDAQAGTVDAEILPGHSLPDSLPAFLRDKKGMLVSEREGYAMKRDVPLLVVHDGCEPVEGRRYRFRFEKPAAVRVFAVGDIYVLDPRWLGEADGSGTEVNGGEDVVFFNLTIRSAANECLASFYANRHALLHVRLERSAGRALAVNNGGNNHHNARTGPWLEGCLFENCDDDVCHVNGYAIAVRVVVQTGLAFTAGYHIARAMTRLSTVGDCVEIQAVAGSRHESHLTGRADAGERRSPGQPDRGLGVVGKIQIIPADVRWDGRQRA